MLQFVPDEVGSHHEVFHPTKAGFILSEMTDLVEKKHPLSVDKGCFFSAKERPNGAEPR